MPNATNTEDILAMTLYANDVSGGILAPLLLLAIYIIIFVAMISVSAASVAFLSASFISMVLSIILSVLGLIAPKWMYLLILATAAGVLWRKFEG